jgi:hypothetical protein
MSLLITITYHGGDRTRRGAQAFRIGQSHGTKIESVKPISKRFYSLPKAYAFVKRMLRKPGLDATMRLFAVQPRTLELEPVAEWHITNPETIVLADSVLTMDDVT